MNTRHQLFFNLGMDIVERGKTVWVLRSPKAIEEKRFRSFFGTDAIMCHRLWVLCEPKSMIGGGVEEKHLLRALLFLKLYLPESVSSRLVGADEKTVRKWCWLFVREISYLKCRVVSQRFALIMVSLGLTVSI